MSLSTPSLLPTPLRRLQVLRLPGPMVQLLVFNAIIKGKLSLWLSVLSQATGRPFNGYFHEPQAPKCKQWCLEANMASLCVNWGWWRSLAVLPEDHDGLVQVVSVNKMHLYLCYCGCAFKKNIYCVDDWSYQRPSYSYFLGDVMNIEASVYQYNHVPLRVFVDRCVATQVPDVNSLPRYSFIENYG